MARLPYFDPAQAIGPRAKRTFERFPPLNLIRILGHCGEMIEAFTKLGMQILMYSSIDPQLRELAIMRVGVLCKCKYEFHQHAQIARSLGLSETTIEAVREGPGASAFTDRQRLVLRLTDDVVKNIRASDETFKAALEALGPKALQELVIAIGYYVMVSFVAETFDVEIEDKPVSRLQRAHQMPPVDRDH